MGEHSTEDELVALEHEWAQAVVENDLYKLECIVGQEWFRSSLSTLPPARPQAGTCGP
jgi:hypothetical protein